MANEGEMGGMERERGETIAPGNKAKIEEDGWDVEATDTAVPHTTASADGDGEMGTYA